MCGGGGGGGHVRVVCVGGLHVAPVYPICYLIAAAIRLASFAILPKRWRSISIARPDAAYKCLPARPPADDGRDCTYYALVPSSAGPADSSPGGDSGVVLLDSYEPPLDFVISESPSLPASLPARLPASLRASLRASQSPASLPACQHLCTPARLRPCPAACSPAFLLLLCCGNLSAVLCCAMLTLALACPCLMPPLLQTRDVTAACSPGPSSQQAGCPAAHRTPMASRGGAPQLAAAAREGRAARRCSRRPLLQPAQCQQSPQGLLPSSTAC